MAGGYLILAAGCCWWLLARLALLALVTLLAVLMLLDLLALLALLALVALFAGKIWLAVDCLRLSMSAGHR